jgi:hypothetical protein
MGAAALILRADMPVSRLSSSGQDGDHGHALAAALRCVVGAQRPGVAYVREHTGGAPAVRVHSGGTSEMDQSVPLEMPKKFGGSIFREQLAVPSLYENCKMMYTTSCLLEIV